MNPDRRYVFGSFELDLPLRELRRRGVPVVLGPRQFDLLKLLIEERHRVVPRARILESVWAGRVTTAGVLPQAMLKLRQALDDGSGTVWFKNVRGVGYRFLPEVQVAASARAPVVPHAPAGGRADLVRVGILPCLNQTRETAMDWLCLGLPAMTAQILGADERLSLIGAAMMTEYVSQAEEPALSEDLALRALRDLGLDVVVQGRLTRQSGLLWLHGDLVFADGRRVPVASLRGPQWPALSLRWAQAVQAMLAAGPGATLEAMSPDPFAVEAFARACELILRGEYTKARPLLQAVHDMEPDQPDVRLQLLRTMWLVGDPQSVPFGQELVAMLRQQGARPSLLALSHVALAMAWLLRPSEDAMAEVLRQLELALQQCRGHEQQDWALMVRLNAAAVQGRQGDLPAAAAEFHEVIRLSRRVGNLKRLGNALTGAAVGDCLGGRLALAQQRLDEAMDIWEQRVYHVRSAIHTELSLAEVDCLMGQIDSAVEHADRALARLAAEGFLPYLASALTTCAYLYLDRMDLPRAQQALALYGEQPDTRHPLVESGEAGVRGMCHLLRGEIDAAEQAWRVVHDRAESGNGPGFSVWRAWTVPFLRMAVREGRQALRARLEASIRDHRHAAGDVELSGVLAHVAACDAVAAGRLDAAMAILEEAARQPALGREPALAALDLAWMLLDAGRDEQAQDLLARTGPWREQHPLGRLVQAKLLHGRGDVPGAVLHHEAARAMLGGPSPAWVLAWPEGRLPAPRLALLLSAAHFSPARLSAWAG